MQHANIRPIYMNQILQLLTGRSVAIVGNGNVKEDVSKEIDASDVVVRFNNFYNYDSGRVGKRVDVIFQTVTRTWHLSPIKHLDVIHEQNPCIFIIKRPDLYQTNVHAIYGEGVKVDKTLASEFQPWYRFTTGTCVLAYLAKNLTNAKVRCYGFQDEEDFERYMKSDALHYAYLKNEERSLMMESIKKLESLQITSPSNDVPCAVVIPVKRSSEGANGKNRKLIRPCLDKLVRWYQVHVVGDDKELLDDLKREYGGAIHAHLTQPIEKYADVTDTLRQWRDETQYCGNVVLVQCTSPYLKVEWVDRCIEGLKYSPLTATACEVGFKPTALFKFENNVYIPYTKEAPAPSVARQKLQKTIRITGAVEAFHSDALSLPSFFGCGTLMPVMVSQEEALDVDTLQDLKKALHVLDDM